MPSIFNRDASNMDLVHHPKTRSAFNKHPDDQFLSGRAKFIRDHFDYDTGSNILESGSSPSLDIYSREKQDKEELPMRAGIGANCVIKK